MAPLIVSEPFRNGIAIVTNMGVRLGSPDMRRATAWRHEPKQAEHVNPPYEIAGGPAKEEQVK
jgi:hypothetical protein